MGLLNLDHLLFYDLLNQAIADQRGFAAGKMGYSEQAILRYPLIKANFSKQKISAYEIFLRYHCEYQTGIYPTIPSFLEQFSHFYKNSYDQLDVLGLFGNPKEQEILKAYQWPCKKIHYLAMEPNRQLHAAQNNCYLDLFKGKKILILSPFAQFLQSRALQDIYENAWQKIDKKWFFPRSISSIQFPYSYKTTKPEQSEFKNSFQLFESICQKIDQLDFDVALIGAGALGIPLAAHVKKLGKIGLSLGGHLQVIFGVSGARWRNDPEWAKQYLNEYWVDLPDSYRPPLIEQLTDAGAYW
jgi:hypothetical protein